MALNSDEVEPVLLVEIYDIDIIWEYIKLLIVYNVLLKFEIRK